MMQKLSGLDTKKRRGEQRKFRFGTPWVLWVGIGILEWSGVEYWVLQKEKEFQFRYSDFYSEIADDWIPADIKKTFSWKKSLFC